MSYPPEAIHEMSETLPKYIGNLVELQSRHVMLGATHSGALAEHLTHGAGRRLSVLRRALTNIFRIFPPARPEKLNEEELSNVQINIHAYCINVAGIFDNWAWAFVLHHDLLEMVGGKHGVDLFKENLQKFLPPELARQAKSMREWHAHYLKGYRDSLAHRIPLYIPPFWLTPQETEQYLAIEKERHELLFSGELERYESATAELEKLGKSAPVFLHSFEFGDKYRPVSLHPQVLADCATVVECGNVFLQHWQARA